MKLIALTGLVTVEKLRLAAALAAHFMQAGRSVAVIDNSGGPAVDMAPVGEADMTQLHGDITHRLVPALERLERDIVLLAVSPGMHPEATLMALENAQDVFAGLEVRTLALVDARTCD